MLSKRSLALLSFFTGDTEKTTTKSVTVLFGATSFKKSTAVEVMECIDIKSEYCALTDVILLSIVMVSFAS